MGWEEKREGKKLNFPPPKKRFIRTFEFPQITQLARREFNPESIKQLSDVSVLATVLA